MVLAIAVNPTTFSQVQMGVSVGEEGVRGFYLAVVEYFRLPEREIIIKERGAPEEELLVMFFHCCAQRRSKIKGKKSKKKLDKEMELRQLP